jgi:hypothetical protein
MLLSLLGQTIVTLRDRMWYLRIHDCPATDAEDLVKDIGICISLMTLVILVFRMSFSSMALSSNYKNPTS